MKKMAPNEVRQVFSALLKSGISVIPERENNEGKRSLSFERQAKFRTFSETEFRNREHHLIVATAIERRGYSR